MSTLLNKLNNLKTNIFGGPGNTGKTTPILRRSPIELASTNPLIGKLDDDPFAFSSISYPRDMSNYQQHGHYMIFYINVQENTKYNYEGTGTTGGHPRQRKPVKVGGKVVKEVPVYENVAVGTTDINPNLRNVTKYKKQIVDYKTSVQAGNGLEVGYRSNIRKGIKGFHDSEGNDLSLKRQQASSGANVSFNTTTRVTDSIALYLPPNIESNYGVNYNAHETGMLGFLAATASGAISSIKLGDNKAAAQALIGGAEGLLQNAAVNAIAAASELIAGAEGGEELFNKAFGRANNPYMEVLFDRPELREFTYNFTFVPRSEEETQDVKTIIEMFRFHMAPEMRQDHSRFMTLPSEFDIHYMYQDGKGFAEENSYYNKISTCVLKNCAVNYTPDGVQSHADGSPVKITMSLTFAETEIIHKDMVKRGF